MHFGNVAKLVISKLTKFSHYGKKRNCFVFLGLWGLFLVLSVFVFTEFYAVVNAYLEPRAEDNLRYYRDVYSQDPWPRIEQTNGSRPGDLPFNAHYFWCGEKVFRFEDYIGILSIVRVLKPMKIIFHYNKLPIIDSFWYHTWFQELKQSVPNLVLRQSYNSYQCGSISLLEFVLGQISVEGGVYVGEKTILTGLPKQAWTSDFIALFRKPDNALADVTKGVVYSKNGFPPKTIKSKVALISKQKSFCSTVKEFDSDRESNAKFASDRRKGNSVDGENCVLVTDSFYPKDIWNSTTPFGEFCRWLFYGKRKRFQVEPDPEDTPLIPMISHVVWMRTDNLFKSNEFKFLHYLSVVSALYVAKFERVYVHGELMPFGKWWDQLMARHGQWVTFIKIEQPETVFQQRVGGPAHQSDVLRLNTLLRHGGAYQDRDVVWVSEIPRDVRRYQAVACVDWPRNGAWPEVFNLGVMMAKPGAQWLKHFLQTFSYYRDDQWAFNAVMMPYKAYEFNPDTLYVDRHLQVICFKGICHPAWHEDYIRDIDDVTPVRDFDWRNARAFHFTVPKPPESLTSPKAIRNGNDVFAQMGRMILEKSSRLDLLN